MSGAPKDSDQATLDALLRSMRAYHAGDTAARAPVMPGEGGSIAEASRLFNAIAERAALLERRLVHPLAGWDAPSTAGAPARRGGSAGNAQRAILVFEDASATAALEPMRAAAQSALRGLGGGWERATVLAVRSGDDVAAALGGGTEVVCALLDARSPIEPLLDTAHALQAAAPEVPVIYFAPEGDHVSADRSAAAARGHDRAEVVRSIGQASERLTLLLLTAAPGARHPIAQPSDADFARQRFEGEKVLIVDDDVRNIFAMVSALELYGLTALTADSGFEAIEVLQRTPDVSLVLMDLMMPGLDGYATTARIREQANLAELPIIAVTARGGVSDRERSLAAGINEHVTKPVEVERLLRLIRGLIRA